ncbi:cyclin-dependent kinase 9-like [Sitodiplosis mosellana]|uniref:cyclin-dependent kinase 9-like n=1 Tax=Sitodiplosis mosellana TaxID=263140 RepID=UPI002445023C|nr:cyclin-dependent kinase 9-like [Sitodiplosis mosellana]XP_055315810.1 cyclin-dependent kinase 9-like [Sitodiplosis mosellana]
MATKSIFDCESLDAHSDEPKRQQITYDDDLFGFGYEMVDEVDASPKNVSISVTFAQDAVNGRKNGKRKARVMSEFERGRLFKVAKTNVPSIKVSTNGSSRRTVETESPSKDYKLLREIGCGTYGKVYKAVWNSTKEVIAIKRLICKLNVPHAKENLAFHKREYDNLHELQKCDNIVTLLSGREDQITEDDLQVDLLFEYCPYDLRKIISNTRIIFTFSEIKAFLRQMLLGLDYMHSKSIMHRDFKTENILLTVDGVVKIADFGLSRKFTDSGDSLEKERYTPCVVTQWYRCPELLLHDTKYNESVDMWSLGCVMGEFWNRNPILPGENELGQIKLISKLCGTISPNDWPNLVNLRGFQQIGQLPNDTRKTRTYLKNKPPILTHDQANDFFDKLMRCNPEKRLSACNALNDNFFYKFPLPSKSLKDFMKRILPILCAAKDPTKSKIANPVFSYVY